MAIENEVQQDELNQQDDQANSQDEEAGFAASFGSESPTDEVADEEHPDDEAPAEDDDESAEQVAANGDDENPDDTDSEDQDDEERARLADLISQMPGLKERSEMTELQVRQLNGKIGEINRILKAQQGQPGGKKITKESLKKLNAEFPEIAEMLAEDLADFAMGGSAPVDVEAIVAEKVSAATSQNTEVLERRLLRMAHRDWETVTASEGFRKWVGSLPAEEQQKLASSWDAEYVADKLTEYKTFSQAQKEQSVKRNQRLANAILPKRNSVPKKALATEDDGFNAAFRS